MALPMLSAILRNSAAALSVLSWSWRRISSRAIIGNQTKQHMAITQQIDADIKSAMLAKDRLRLQAAALRCSTSTAMPSRVLMSDTLSAPCSSTARAMSAMDVTFGIHHGRRIGSADRHGKLYRPRSVAEGCGRSGSLLPRPPSTEAPDTFTITCVPKEDVCG